MPNVVVYGRSDAVCMKCRATKRHLKRHGIPFTAVNVDADPVAAAHVRSLGALELPVVQVDGGEFWTGHRVNLLNGLADR